MTDLKRQALVRQMCAAHNAMAPLLSFASRAGMEMALDAALDVLIDDLLSIEFIDDSQRDAVVAARCQQAAYISRTYRSQ